MKRAENELADRNAVTRAAHQIDQRLRSDPANEGESRFDKQRVTFVPPLGVLFEVEEEDRLAHVLQVWQIDTDQ